MKQEVVDQAKLELKVLNEEIASLMKSIAYPNKLTNYHQTLTTIGLLNKEKKNILKTLARQA